MLTGVLLASEEKRASFLLKSSHFNVFVDVCSSQREHISVFLSWQQSLSLISFPHGINFCRAPRGKLSTDENHISSYLICKTLMADFNFSFSCTKSTKNDTFLVTLLCLRASFASQPTLLSSCHFFLEASLRQSLQEEPVT